MSQQATHSERAAVSYLARARQRLAIEAARILFKRQLVVRTPVPLISFTFDDFPRSAFLEAGSILSRHGARGTYYASLGLMGKQSPMGTMYETGDLKELHDWGTSSDATLSGTAIPGIRLPTYTRQAIVENQKALTELLPGIKFQTFAYPYSAPAVAVKRVAGRHFLCCRGGGLQAGTLFSTCGRADVQLRSYRSQPALCVFPGTEPRKSRGGEELDRSECPCAGMADFCDPRCS